MEPRIEELLFNLSCVGDSERLISGEWIYYINSSDMSEEGDGAIWKIRKDGSDNQRVQKSSTKIFYLIDVDEHWIYFAGKSVDVGIVQGLSDVMRAMSCIQGVQNLKMTVRGGLERPMSNDDVERLEDKISELEENV